MGKLGSAHYRQGGCYKKVPIKAGLAVYILMEFLQIDTVDWDDKEWYLSEIIIVFVFNNYLQFIPLVVLSALLIHTGMTMIDPFFNLVKRGFHTCLNKPINEIKKCIKDTLQTFSIVLVITFFDF